MYSSAGRPCHEGHSINVSPSQEKALIIMKPVVMYLKDEQMVSMQYTREKEDRQRAFR